MAIQVMTDKDLSSVSFSEFLLSLEDEKETVAPFNAGLIVDVCNKISSAKTSRAMSKLPDIGDEMVVAMNMIDLYFKSNKYHDELKKSIHKLSSDSELDYFAFMSRNEV